MKEMPALLKWSVAFVIGNIACWFLVKPLYHRNVVEGQETLGLIVYLIIDAMIIGLCFYFIQLFSEND